MFRGYFWSFEASGYFVHFLDFGSILVGLSCFAHSRAFCSFLAMSRCIFLIISDVWGILVIYEISRFDCSF